ncbi:MAG: hypothetical protein ABIA78_01985 [archaeon]
MGMIRGGLFVIVSVILFVLFLVGNVLFTLNLSLDYETIKPELVSVVEDMTEEGFDISGAMDENYEIMEAYCEENSEYVFSKQGYTFVISCESVVQGSEAVAEEVVESIVEQTYYKDYDCDFWDCFGEEEIPLFLVSEKAKDYWESKFYLLMGICAIFVLLMFFLVETKTNLPIVVGALLILSSLPFAKVEWFVSLFSFSSFLDLFSVFFTKAYSVFLISFIVGILILCTGIIMKFFVVGFKINGFFNRFKSNKKSDEGSEKISEVPEESKKVVGTTVKKKK